MEQANLGAEQNLTNAGVRSFATDKTESNSGGS